MLAIGASYETEFTIGGLTPESDYILYGILVDLIGQEMEDPFIIEFNTAEYYDSVVITAHFLDPQPTEAQLTTDVVGVL